MTSFNQFTLADSHAHFWLGKSLGASEQAAHTEWLFMFIMWVNIISFVVLMAIMGYFMLKYRRGNQSKNYAVSVSHNTVLELTWSIVPLLVMIPIFYWGFKGYMDKIASPADAEELSISGKKWAWSVTYRNGAQPQSELRKITRSGYEVPHFVVPAGRPVRLVMSSQDVLHAFYIPDFRVKMDVIPNRYTSLWFTPKEPGVHTVYCAEYCGDFHSEMAAVMEVVSLEEFERTIKQWTDYNEGLTILKVGELVYKRKGCNACHSVDGSKNTGPTWKDMYLDTHDYPGETGKLVDENWLRENILYSQRRIMTGYPASMPVYAGQLTSLELDALILYTKSLSSRTTPDKLDKKDQTVKQYREAEKAKP